MRRVLPIIALLLAAPSLFAWGEKGHTIVNEAATLSLPADMPVFFYKAFPQIVWTAYDPDRWKGAGESLDASNPPEHFIDYEFVEGIDLPRDRYKYIDRLYATRTLRRHGISNSTIGFLPWRIAEISDRLTNEWRQWRASVAGSRERTFIEADIVRDAGLLGHYVADAANPHHATFNYNGWVLSNPNGYATDCNVHDRFERFFISHAVSTSDVTPRVAAAVPRTDYFGAAMALIKDSNAQVETIYRIDRDHGFDQTRVVSPEGLQFASSRLAAGAGMLRDLWWSTWTNSGKPPRRRGEE